ncbi:MAG TPA: MFS transporter [Alphaproteobacteria bacterium]|nr:MFS transporter [Alphaproteobacteria bacterium]
MEPSWPKPSLAWVCVTLLMLANGVAVLDRVVLGLLVQPIERDLGIGDARMGLLQGFAFSIFYGGLGIPIGMLADRGSRRAIVAVGVGLWSLATAACGFAQGFVALFLARVGVGIGEASIAPAGASLIADYFPPLARPKAYGIYIMGTSVGTGAAFLLGASALVLVDRVRALSPSLFAAFRDWQIVFLIVSLPGLAIAFLFRLLVREPPRQGASAVRGLSFGPLFKQMRRNGLAYAGLMSGCALNVLSIYAILGWYPTLFIRIHHWTAAEIGGAIGTFGVPGGMLSAISSGFVIAWLARRGRRDAPVLLALATTPAFLVLGLASCLIANADLAFIAFVAMAIFTNWSSSAVLTGLNQITPNAFRGQVVAFYTLINGIVAVGFGPTSVGLLTQYVVGPEHIDVALAAVLGLCSIGGAFCLLVSRAAFARAAQAAA